MNAVGSAQAAPVVYLSPQALNPLSASSVPISMALPAKPDMTEKSAGKKAAEEHSKAAAQVDLNKAAPAQQVHAAHQHQQQISVSQAVAKPGKVDVYV